MIQNATQALDSRISISSGEGGGKKLSDSKQDCKVKILYCYYGASEVNSAACSRVRGK